MGRSLPRGEDRAPCICSPIRVSPRATCSKGSRCFANQDGPSSSVSLARPRPPWTDKAQIAIGHLYCASCKFAEGGRWQMEKRKRTISTCRLCGIYQNPHFAIFSDAGRSQSESPIACQLNLSAEADGDSVICRSCWRKLTSVAKSTEALRTLAKRAGPETVPGRSAGPISTTPSSGNSPAISAGLRRRFRTDCQFSPSGVTPSEKRSAVFRWRPNTEPTQAQLGQRLPSSPTSVVRPSAPRRQLRLNFDGCHSVGSLLHSSFLFCLLCLNLLHRACAGA